MSRTGLSAAALRSMFAQDADTTLITLLTITGTGIATPIRLCDNYTQRISETDEEILYGVVSRSNNYYFLPFEITLPSEQVDSAPRATIKIYDVTRYLIPSIRTLTSAPSVLLELVLSSSPSTVEVSFPGFLLGAINYNADSITAELAVETLTIEPFPAHTFTPSYFPGLF